MRIRESLSIAARTVALVGMTACTAASFAAPPTLTLREVLLAARQNADVAIAAQEVQAARGDLLAADRAPFPLLSAKAASIDLQNGVGGGNAITQKRVDKALGLDWTWERGGKRALRTQAAQQGIAAAQADLDEARLQQLIAAQAAYYDLLAAQQKLAEVDALAESAGALVGITQRREKAGDAARQDVMRSEVEAARVVSDRAVARLEVDQAALALAQSMGTQWPEPPVAAAAWPEFAELPATSDAAAIESRADVRAALAREAAARSQHDAALALSKADVTWGASIDHYPGTSDRMVELRLQVPLQFGDSHRGEAERARAQWTQATLALDKTRRNAGLDLQRLRSEVATALERARRFDAEIVPRARQVADGAELAYRRGALSLTDLFEVRRVLRTTLLEAIAARADHAKALGAWRLRTASSPDDVLLAGAP